MDEEVIYRFHNQNKSFTIEEVEQLLYPLEFAEQEVIRLEKLDLENHEQTHNDGGYEESNELKEARKKLRKLINE